MKYNTQKDNRATEDIQSHPNYGFPPLLSITLFSAEMVWEEEEENMHLMSNTVTSVEVVLQ